LIKAYCHHCPRCRLRRPEGLGLVDTCSTPESQNLLPSVHSVTNQSLFMRSWSSGDHKTRLLYLFLNIQLMHGSRTSSGIDIQVHVTTFTTQLRKCSSRCGSASAKSTTLFRRGLRQDRAPSVLVLRRVKAPVASDCQLSRTSLRYG
jgi:hypothetical protein